MSKKLTLANKIRQLSKGQRFTLSDHKMQSIACTVIKALRDAGVLQIEVITRKNKKTGTVEVIAL